MNSKFELYVKMVILKNNNNIFLLHTHTNGNSEYLRNNVTNYYDKSPQDIIMKSPEENYKNVFISIRDRANDEQPTKRPKKSNYLMPNSHTDSVSPIIDLAPKMAYTDKFVPGKAVKVNPDLIVRDEKVSDCLSLESYLQKDETAEELYKRRVSVGTVETIPKSPVKKRCSTTTIRKLTKKGDVMTKSRSEVSKLCEKMKHVKLIEKDSGKNYKTRSCNDIVKLVLTKHGIHVISDTEAIV